MSSHYMGEKKKKKTFDGWVTMEKFVITKKKQELLSVRTIKVRPPLRMIVQAASAPSTQTEGTHWSSNDSGTD